MRSQIWDIYTWAKPRPDRCGSAANANIQGQGDSGPSFSHTLVIMTGQTDRRIVGAVTMFCVYTNKESHLIRLIPPFFQSKHNMDPETQSKTPLQQPSFTSKQRGCEFHAIWKLNWQSGQVPRKGCWILRHLDETGLHFHLQQITKVAEHQCGVGFVCKHFTANITGWPALEARWTGLKKYIYYPPMPKCCAFLGVEIKPMPSF